VPIETAMCLCDTGPWVLLSMLDVKRNDDTGISITCPDEHCLLGAPVVSGAIAEHGRNVPGTCPWVGVRILHEVPRCGHGPRIWTRQLKAPISREKRHPRGAIKGAKCPGCGHAAPVTGGAYGTHGDAKTPCEWTGVMLIDRGHYPNIFRPEHGR
jgi:hypothetical protein